jgi:hypothetical protein
MMTLTAVRDGLVTRLNTISGLRVYETPPAVVQEFPAAILTQREPFASYDQVIGGPDVRYSFEVLVLVRSGDEGQAFSELEAYVSPAGASSVKAAVDGDLDGNADWARVVQAPSVGRVTYQRVAYWGATFRVDVYESG